MELENEEDVEIFALLILTLFCSVLLHYMNVRFWQVVIHQFLISVYLTIPRRKWLHAIDVGIKFRAPSSFIALYRVKQGDSSYRWGRVVGLVFLAAFPKEDWIGVVICTETYMIEIYKREPKRQGLIRQCLMKQKVVVLGTKSYCIWVIIFRKESRRISYKVCFSIDIQNIQKGL